MSANEGPGKGKALGGAKNAQKIRKSGKDETSNSSDNDKVKTEKSTEEKRNNVQSANSGGAKLKNNNIMTDTFKVNPEKKSAPSVKAAGTKGVVGAPTNSNKPKIATVSTRTGGIDKTKSTESSLIKSTHLTKPISSVKAKPIPPSNMKKISQTAKSATTPTRPVAQTKSPLPGRKVAPSSKPASKSSAPAKSASTVQSNAQTKPTVAATKSSVAVVRDKPSKGAAVKSTGRAKSPAKSQAKASSALHTQTSTSKRTSSLPKIAAAAKSAVKSGTPVATAKFNTVGSAKTVVASKGPAASAKSTRTPTTTSKVELSPQGLMKAATPVPIGPKTSKTQQPKKSNKQDEGEFVKTKTPRKSSNIPTKKAAQQEPGKKQTRKPNAVSRTRMPSSWTPGAENLTPPLKLRPRTDRWSHSEFPQPPLRRSRARSRSSDGMSGEVCGSPLPNSAFASPLNVASPTSGMAAGSPFMGIASPLPWSHQQPPPVPESPVKSVATEVVRKRTDHKTGSLAETSGDANAMNTSSHSNTSSILVNHQAELDVFSINKLLRQPVPVKSKDRILPPTKNEQGTWVEPPVFVFGDPKTGQSLWKRGKSS